MPKINALARGSSEQRNSLNHQAIEDYLKTIYALAEVETPVTTSRLAEARQVKPGSVTSMVQRLARLKLVDYEKHYGVTLTDAGRKVALEVIRHHRLIELYLKEALGFSWDEVHDQADILEHVISEKLEERIAAALNHPQFDPHGDPIPAKDGTFQPVEDRPLSAMAIGERGRVSRVLDDEDSDLLVYLAQLGLVPGADIEVVNVAPFAGPLTIAVAGASQVVGQKVAESVLIEDVPVDRP